MRRTVKSHLNSPVIFTKNEIGRSLSGATIIADSFFKNSPLAKSLSKSGASFYWVKAGEELKELNHLPKHISAVAKLISKNEKKLIVALGGGSVGDFAGFIASVFHRGIQFIQIPTTYLAAIDSAHGGKTALNAFGKKNQVGTFYQASEIYIVQKLLPQKSKDDKQRIFEAWFELIKIALLSSKAKTKELVSSGPNAANLWKQLPFAVKEKYKVVALDPHEKFGHRRILNLGHTVGHVLEAHLKISHGVAVGLGLKFALQWSFKKGHISWQEFEVIYNALNRWLKLAGIKDIKPLTEKAFRKLLKGDKKSNSKEKLIFIFLKGFGKPLQEEVTLTEVCDEARAQGLIE